MVLRSDADVTSVVAMLKSWAGDEPEFRDLLADVVLYAGRMAIERDDDASLFEGIESSTGIAASLLRKYLAGAAPANRAVRLMVIRAAAAWLEGRHLSN